MAITNQDYLGQLHDSVADLLSGVLSETSPTMFSLFRRSSAVVATTLPVPGSMYYHLELAKLDFPEEGKGTFTAPTDDGRVLVFRAPARVSASFLLSNPSLGGASRTAAHDRLLRWFFDNRSIEPFLPSSFDRYPQLRELIRSHRAEMRMCDASSVAATRAGFVFGFTYTALYHSGSALREEGRVQTRTIVFPSENKERNLQ